MGTLHTDIAVTARSLSISARLDVPPGITALVGPSGAGKSTILRCIAGLVRPDSGTISVGDEVWFDSERRIDVPVESRPIGLMFQSLALFPHLSVARNVGYGSDGDVGELLERLGIAGLAGVKPGRLSGGERQRVALARTLARRPAVLLLDEPTSSLDARTAATIRAELGNLLPAPAIPTLVVTHDFEEAAMLADEIAVIVDGTIRQVGTPADLVASPKDDFTAALTGANVMPGVARPGPSGLSEITLEGGAVVYSTEAVTGPVGVVLHPWDVTVALRRPEDSSLNHVSARVASVTDLGARVRVRIGPVVAELTSSSAQRLGLHPGTEAVASFKATATRLVPSSRAR